MIRLFWKYERKNSKASDVSSPPLDLFPHYYIVYVPYSPKLAGTDQPALWFWLCNWYSLAAAAE